MNVQTGSICTLHGRKIQVLHTDGEWTYHQSGIVRRTVICDTCGALVEEATRVGPRDFCRNCFANRQG